MLARFTLAVLLSFALVLPAPYAQATAVHSTDPVGPVLAGDDATVTHVTPRYIVELRAPPLAQWPGDESVYQTQSLRAPNGRLDATSPGAQQYIEQLRQQQQQLWSQVQTLFPQAALERQYQVVLNGFAVALPDADAEHVLAQLRALPNVAQVYVDQVYHPTMYSSIEQINAPAVWADPQIGGEANAGAGIKVAIIDAGIRLDNPFFDPTGYTYPPGFPKGDAAHTSPKVIAARAYFRPDAPPVAGSETPQPGPEDSGHGTHVAGTVAGNANTSATFAGIERAIGGVAPRAYLLNYKTFYHNESIFSGSAFGVELIAALEDAVRDGADIINNSWGGRADAFPNADPIARAANAAVDAGVVVVFSAGNEGPNASTAGAPAYSDKLIAVGAVTKAEEIAANFVDVVAPEGVPATLQALPFGSAAFGVQLGSNDLFGPAPYQPVADVTGSTLACEPLLAGSISGRVALVERGTCPFSVKAYHAQLGGASAVIIYNSPEGGETVFRLAGGPNADLVTIPVVAVTRSAGQQLLDWRATHGDAAQLQIDGRARLAPRQPDVLAGFSSRGPSFQGSLKPDVVAPGVNILSAGFGQGSGIASHQGFGQASGTSMAAPHVAGAAALLKQLHPDWGTAEVKSALMSTASLQVYRSAELLAGAAERGAGRIDVAAAARVGLLFDRPSLSFANLLAVTGQPTLATLSVTARNITSAPLTFELTTQQSDGLTLRVPPSITVGPGASTRFEVGVEFAPGAAPGDYDGLVLLQGTEQPLHLPVYARLRPAEFGAQVLLLDNDGSANQGLPDYSGYYGNILTEQNIGFHYLDADALADQLQTLPPLPELQRYEMVLWFTGDNSTPSDPPIAVAPLTRNDQDLLIAYLQGGGNLIATGQNLTEASDINRNPPDDPRYGRSDVYHSYLGARWVQGNVFTQTTTTARVVQGQATGANALQPWLTGVRLDLSTPSDTVSGATSAGNQNSIDEVTIVDSDPRTPDLFTTRMLQTPSSGAEGGTVGLNRFDAPSLEEPEVGIPYRSTYLAFGLEGVRDDTGATTRKELLQQILFWTVDRPSVTLSSSSTVSAGQPTSFVAEAQSNTPTSFVRYRWDWGDGSPFETSDAPTVEHAYTNAGNYIVRVEATNAWGHRAIGSLSVTVAEGIARTTASVASPARRPMFRPVAAR